MADLTTTYMGLELKNPIIVGSCGLSGSAEKVQELERHGAGAVVLKSLFEEEIALEHAEVLEQVSARGYDPDAYEYYDYQIRGERLDAYARLIADSKRRVSIPVIASVNCTYSHEWASYARALESAGADALELNAFYLPSDMSRTSVEQEQRYFDLVERVLREVSIPVALKISYYFSSLGLMIQRLSETGIGGLVLFNRFYTPDFDIDALKVVSRHMLSTPDELGLSLRWVAMMSSRVKCDLVASTGIHDGAAVIKQLLAGARAVQVVSALYRNGTAHIQTMLDELSRWMIRNEFYALEQFVGKMSQAESENPAVYERVQFMRYAGGGSPE